ncbi:RES domain-containing protein [Saccharibacillus sp. VR-M41]|uniref:RES domain-containing protein n=1 Tax=Saccharibacillus alkalitolerans TaxID=2705290 RepID=A0ABX0FCE1_9BACL|nr:RES domain-containing protein [Saccharibacillus alkalitolerans]NGZ77174.1 RES domain-containing protein [Saccharibacillus alkalitolerans]
MPQALDLLDKTLCSSCGEAILDYLKSHNVNKEQIDSEELTHQESEDLRCENCSRSIVKYDVYYFVNIENDLLETATEALSEEIGGCENCEGNERAHMVHSFNNDPFDQESRIDFDDVRGISVSEYLYDQRVPEEFHELFIQFMKCPCGYGDGADPNDNPDGGYFELDDDIYTRAEIAEFWGFDDSKFCEFAKQYDVFFSIDDLSDFRGALLKNPMLAYRNETGRAIYEALKLHFEKAEYFIVRADGSSLYRGRTRKKDLKEAYSKDGMWSPPVGKPQHGRFNAIGVSVLYVTNDSQAVPYEINPSHEDVIDIAEFKVTQDLKVFDIGNFDPDFQGFFNEKNEGTDLLKQAYLLPNYIGACCSSIGYAGVKYEGVHSDLKYTNLALFEAREKGNIKVSDKVTTYTVELTYQISKNSDKA